MSQIVIDYYNNHEIKKSVLMALGAFFASIIGAIVCLITASIVPWWFQFDPFEFLKTSSVIIPLLFALPFCIWVVVVTWRDSSPEVVGNVKVNHPVSAFLLSVVFDSASRITHELLRWWLVLGFMGTILIFLNMFPSLSWVPEAVSAIGSVFTLGGFYLFIYLPFGIYYTVSAFLTLAILFAIDIDTNIFENKIVYYIYSIFMQIVLFQYGILACLCIALLIYNLPGLVYVVRDLSKK